MLRRQFALPLVAWALLGLSSCGEPPQLALRPGMDPDSVFTADVIPLLKRECGVCHFAGGEMYSTMPFDEASVLLDLEGEVLVRAEGDARSRLASWYAWFRGMEETRRSGVAGSPDTLSAGRAPGDRTGVDSP